MMSAAPQQRYDLLEKTTELLKSGQESVIKASLEYLQVKAKITVCYLLYLMNHRHIYNDKGSQNESYLFLYG